MRIFELVRSAVFSGVVAAAFLGSAGGALAIDEKLFDDKTGVKAQSNPWEVFQFGYSAYKSGHKDQAAEAYRYAAENGQIGASWKLARMYAEGDGVDRNDYEAFKFFTEIAEQEVEPGSPEDPTDPGSTDGGPTDPGSDDGTVGTAATIRVDAGNTGTRLYHNHNCTVSDAGTGTITKEVKNDKVGITEWTLPRRTTVVSVGGTFPGATRVVRYPHDDVDGERSVGAESVLLASGRGERPLPTEVRRDHPVENCAGADHEGRVHAQHPRHAAHLRPGLQYDHQ